MTTTTGRSVFTRDRLTYVLYASFMTWGWYLYGLSPAVPLIAEEQGISRGLAGLHGTAMALGTVTTGLISSKVATRFGRKVQALTGSGFIVAGIALLLSGDTLAVTLPAVFLSAVGGNLTMSSAQPALTVHHGRAGPAAVTEANAMGAGFGLLAPLAVGGSVALGWGWRPAVAFAVVLTAITALLISRLPAIGAMGRGEVNRGLTAQGEDPAPAPSRTFGRTFWYFWVALVSGVAIEFATTFWASDLVAARTDAPASVATASVSALVIGMCISRLVAGPLSLRKAPEKLLVLGFAVAAAGWLVFWLATTPAAAIAGLVIAGLGYGTHYPLALSLAMRASDGRPDHAQARVSFGIGGAVGIAPFLLGALADSFGAHMAFLLVPVLVAIGATAVLLGLASVRRTGAAP